MTPHAQLDWQDGQPVSLAFGDVYFSRASGLDETRHVFLRHNRLAERFAELPSGGHFTIAETGFGTGLNFLCAWECFLQYAPVDTRLHFISAEKFPLTPRDLTQALALWPQLAGLAQQLLAQYQALPPGWHRLLLNQGRVTLTLLIGDVLEVLPEVDARVDAWFLDGFAPSKNPDMWQAELFQAMARLSAPGATFATFTSAGFVRRGLSEAGFAVSKTAGFGHKREMSHGHLQTLPAGEWSPPWFARPARRHGERSAIVIGGGIAGAASAYSLACRGWQVTVVERLPELARGASGNPQGVLYTKLSPHFTPLTRLILSGYGYSLRTLKTQLPEDDANWRGCGVLQLAYDAAEAERQQGLASAGFGADFLRPVDASEASELAGVELQHGGLFFPEGGWVNPPALVRKLVDHPNIQVRTSRTIVELDYNPLDKSWVAIGDEGSVAIGSVVILAGAAETGSFDATQHLPLKKIRGQVTVARATEHSEALRTVLCGEGYISPARFGEHCLGATFKFNTEDLGVNLFEHQENLQMLAGLAPSLYQALGGEGLLDKALAGRAALRCTSPDYLPIVGPVAHAQSLIDAYLPLSKDASLKLSASAPWIDGLYVNTAHGSRGMITAPLSGEILAALLEDEPAPVARSLMQATHPSRFLIRDLMRNKVPQQG